MLGLAILAVMLQFHLNAVYIKFYVILFVLLSLTFFLTLPYCKHYGPRSDCSFMVIWEQPNQGSAFVFVLLCVRSSFAIILKRKLVTLLLLSYRCIVTINVMWLFLTVPWVMYAVCNCGIS